MNNIPWRMILLLIVIFLISFFAVCNLNTTEVSVGFYVFKDVPLFQALIVSFILGALFMLPFTIKSKKKKKSKKDVKKEEKQEKKDAKTDKQEVKKQEKVNKKNKKNKNKKGTESEKTETEESKDETVGKK